MELTNSWNTHVHLLEAIFKLKIRQYFRKFSPAFLFLATKIFAAHRVKNVKYHSYLSSSASYKDVCSIPAKRKWIFNPLPNICAAIAIPSRVLEVALSNNTYNLANKITCRLKSTITFDLRFFRLDLHTLYLLFYSNAAKNALPDMKNQVAFIILLMNFTNHCSILQYLMYKYRAGTQFSQVGKTVAFADAFDNAFIPKHNLKRILGNHLPMIMLTD